MTPAWQIPYLDRVQRMIHRDFNHPSIVIWSMGNESGDGPNVKACYDWVKDFDSSRPFHYQGTSRKKGVVNADLISRMYSDVKSSKKTVDQYSDVPYMLCEYTHAMGNSNGNLKEYWDLIYADNNFFGAFVWDWMDQGIKQQVSESYSKIANKDHFYAYGGWWENNPSSHVHNDGNFCMNGVLAADQTPHPSMAAFKYWQRYVHIIPVDLEQGSFEVQNWYDFSNLKDKVYIEWQMIKDGWLIAKGNLGALNVKARGGKTVHINYPEFYREDGEVFINFLIKTKQKTFFAPVDYELATEQFFLGKKKDTLPLIDDAEDKLYVKDFRKNLTVKGKSFTAVFEKNLGILKSYSINDNKVLEEGPVPDFWRAPTDNDLGLRRDVLKDGWPDLLKWKGTHIRNDVEFDFKEKEGMVMVNINSKLPLANATYNMTYTIYPSGIVDVKCDYNPDAQNNMPDFMPRFGNYLVLGMNYDNIKWYGRGPEPTYVDRKTEKIGIYNSTVDDEWVDYSHPQENGYKVDTRWVEVTNGHGTGLRFTGEETFGFGASHYTKEEIERADYSFELNKNPRTFLNIDKGQMGVGGTDSWSKNALPLEKYRILNTSMSYQYRITPIFQ